MHALRGRERDREGAVLHKMVRKGFPGRWPQSTAMNSAEKPGMWVWKHTCSQPTEQEEQRLGDLTWLNSSRWYGDTETEVGLYRSWKGFGFYAKIAEFPEGFWAEKWCSGCPKEIRLSRTAPPQPYWHPGPDESAGVEGSPCTVQYLETNWTSLH